MFLQTIKSGRWNLGWVGNQHEQKIYRNLSLQITAHYNFTIIHFAGWRKSKFFVEPVQAAICKATILAKIETPAHPSKLRTILVFLDKPE